MYNNIPHERTSKQTIFVFLLCCITLLSVFAAGYFAWMVHNIQHPEVLVEQTGEQTAELSQEGDVVETSSEPGVPVFTYPEILQPELRTQDPEDGGSRFLAMLDDWQEANEDAGVCVQVRSYLEDVSYPSSYRLSAKEILTNAGVRSALLSYFAVSSANEQTFFAGIDAALDDNDMFAQDATMCASSGGARKFLLLDDVQTTMLDDGRTSSQSFPEILEWHEPSPSGFIWTDYVGDYQVMDGYRFYPDWHGNVLVQTGYGDAGYSHWEVQLLEVSAGIPVLTLLEKCSSAPSENWSESITTCEVAYTE